MRLQTVPSILKLQSNSYLGLWGSMFDGVAQNTSAHASLPSRLQGWRQEAEEAQSRLLQRLRGHGSGGERPSWNATDLLADLTAAYQSSDQGKGSPVSVAASGLLHHDFFDLPLNSSLAATIIDDIRQRLSGDGDGNGDASQLAALAVLQGWALKALANHRASVSATAGGTASTASSVSTLPGMHRRWPGVQNGSLAMLSEVGVALPDAMGDKFVPAVCARLQNFGNAAGYNSAWLGAFPCNTASNDKSTFAWDSKAAFSLDCSTIPHQPAALDHTIDCAFTVGSQSDDEPSGSGTLLHFARSMHVLTGPHLNAIQIRACNV